MTDDRANGPATYQPPDPAGQAGRIAQQRRAAEVLVKILERAAAEGLPPIFWTITGDDKVGLVGECHAFPANTQRREDFSAWQVALGSWAGRDGDPARRAVRGLDTVVMSMRWDPFDGTRVMLTADISMLPSEPR
jgi:hypothetical protein